VENGLATGIGEMGVGGSSKCQEGLKKWVLIVGRKVSGGRSWERLKSGS